jgi:hypothetical protein
MSYLKGLGENIEYRRRHPTTLHRSAAKALDLFTGSTSGLELKSACSRDLIIRPLLIGING